MLPGARTLKKSIFQTVYHCEEMNIKYLITQWSTNNTIDIIIEAYYSRERILCLIFRQNSSGKSKLDYIRKKLVFLSW